MKRFIWILCLTALCAACSPKEEQTAGVELTPVMHKALNDSTSIFFADFKSFPAERNLLPIGVFDSGTGGLTVLEVMLKLDEFDNVTGEAKPDGIPDFVGEKFQYLGDVANMPYGNYSSEDKDMFFRELVVKDALFLLGQKFHNGFMDKEGSEQKEPCKILVIACNTATAYGLTDIRNLLEMSGTGIKVIGVINAGVNALFSQLGDGEDSSAVGVLATKGTIASGAYQRTIEEMASKLAYKGKLTVVNQPCAGFAESVDTDVDFADASRREVRDSYRGPVLGSTLNDIREDLIPVYHFASANGELLTAETDSSRVMQLNASCNYARLHLVNLIERYREMGGTAPMKHIILGCTHYPFLLDTLKKAVQQIREYTVDGVAVYAKLLPENVNFIDPAKFTAVEAFNALREDKQLALSLEDTQVSGYISVPVYGLLPDQLTDDGELAYDFKYGREHGTEDITTVNVALLPRYVSEENMNRLASLVPVSYSYIFGEKSKLVE